MRGYIPFKQMSDGNLVPCTEAEATHWKDAQGNTVDSPFKSIKTHKDAVEEGWPKVGLDRKWEADDLDQAYMKRAVKRLRELSIKWGVADADGEPIPETPAQIAAFDAAEKQGVSVYYADYPGYRGTEPDEEIPGF